MRRGMLLLPAVAVIGWLAAPAGAHQGHDHGGAYEAQDHGGAKEGHDHGDAPGAQDHGGAQEGQDHGGARDRHDHGGAARRPKKNQVVTEGGFYPMGPEGKKVFGSAKMVRYNRGTDVSVHAAGLAPDTTYEVHVHVGTCSDMGSHYRNDPRAPEGPPNEIWPSSNPDDPQAGMRSDADGYATAQGHADWKARPEARAVMVHESENGFMVSCADLH